MNWHLKYGYPANVTVIKELEEIYHSFHDVIMGADTAELDNFIRDYRESKLNGFVAEMEKDIAPIKNAECYIPFLMNNVDFKLADLIR